MAEGLTQILNYISPRYTGTFQELHGDHYNRTDPADKLKVEEWIKKNTLAMIKETPLNKGYSCTDSIREYLFYDGQRMGTISTQMARHNDDLPEDGGEFHYNILYKIKLSPAHTPLPLDLKQILEEEKIIPVEEAL